MAVYRMTFILTNGVSVVGYNTTKCAMTADELQLIQEAAVTKRGHMTLPENDDYNSAAVAVSLADVSALLIEKVG